MDSTLKDPETQPVDPNNLPFGEKEAGIQEYLTPAKDQVAFTCSMKHRYSDFIVNEIDLNGDVVWFRSELDNQNKWKVSNIRETLPADIQKKLQQIEEDDSRLENDLMIPNAEITEGLKKILGEVEAERFVQFCKDIESGAIEQSSIHDFEGNFADKQRRTEVH